MSNSSSMKKIFVITKSMSDLILSEHKKGRTYGSIVKKLREVCSRSISEKRFLEFLKQNKLKPNFKKSHSISDQVKERIIQLAYRGLSAYVISIQLKAEGVIVDRHKIRRMIEKENKMLKESGLEQIVVNKKIHAPFISNINLQP